MCMGCYEDYGLPKIVSAPVLALAERIKDAEWRIPGLHIAIDDWNLQDRNIEWCRENQRLSDEEQALTADLLKMTFEERVSAMALVDGYLMPDGQLSQIAQDALAEP